MSIAKRFEQLMKDSTIWTPPLFSFPEGGTLDRKLSSMRCTSHSTTTISKVSPRLKDISLQNPTAWSAETSMAHIGLPCWKGWAVELDSQYGILLQRNPSCPGCLGTTGPSPYYWRTKLKTFSRKMFAKQPNCFWKIITCASSGVRINCSPEFKALFLGLCVFSLA